MTTDKKVIHIYQKCVLFYFLNIQHQDHQGCDSTAFRVETDKPDIVAVGQKCHGSKQWEQISGKVKVGQFLGQNALCKKELGPKEFSLNN